MDWNRAAAIAIDQWTATIDCHREQGSWVDVVSAAPYPYVISLSRNSEPDWLEQGGQRWRRVHLGQSLRK